jgi:hypothetical protein
MATRFYFQSGSTPPVTPAFSASWSSTTGMVRLKMDTVKAATAFTDYACTVNPFGGGYTGVIQLVSRPLNGAQSITVSAVRAPIIRVKNSSGLADKDLAYIIRVFSQDGLTVRGTIRSFTFTNGADFGGSYSSRIGILDNLSALSAQDGDRIVCEIGLRNNSDGAGSNAFDVGDASASDLGTTTGETNQYNPWTEFGAITLSFQVEGGTDYTKTVSNSIRSFGPAPSTKWGSGATIMTWGTSNWGEGSEGLPVDVSKYLANSQTLDEVTTPQANFNLSFSHQLTSTFEGGSQTLTDQAGYYYVFVGGVTDSEDRADTTYTEVAASATVWTGGADPGTSWS